LIGVVSLLAEVGGRCGDDVIAVGVAGGDGFLA
jgi:hypothetical protein